MALLILLALASVASASFYDLTAVDIRGQNVTMAQYKGKVRVFDL